MSNNSDSEWEENEQETIANDLVVSKYKAAGNICNRVLERLIDIALPQASARQLCQQGDDWIQEETEKIYKKEKDLRKGIAFPTCIGVNNITGNFSPLHSDPDQQLKAGDLCKIELAVHIDGYIAAAAHSLIVSDKKKQVIRGRAADVMKATYTALDAAMRMIKPGTKDQQITDMVKKISDDFKCKPVQNTLSHRMQRHCEAPTHCILLNPSDEVRKEHEEHDVQLHSVYQLSIILTTGPDGKTRESPLRATVHRKTEETYKLKMRTSRQVLSEAERRFGRMAFTLRALDDEKQARLGVTECVTHKVLHRFPVEEEPKQDELVAHYKATVLLMPTGLHKIAGLDGVEAGGRCAAAQSDLQVCDATAKELLATKKCSGTAASKKQAKKRHAKKQAAGAAEAVAAAVADLQLDDEEKENGTEDSK